jgi:hypothetical protein
MFHVPRLVVRRRGRPNDSSLPETGASGRLRERVLAGVRGEHPRAGPAGAPLGRGLLLPTMSLLVGVAIGGVLVLILAPSTGGPAGSTPAHLDTRASLREFGSRAELLVSGMPEPPIGEIYEVWLLRPGATPKATDALFTVTREGSGTVDVPGGVSQGVGEVMVTSEPLGGSARPTSPPVLRLKVPRAG